MRLTAKERKRFLEILSLYAANEYVLNMKTYQQHGTVSTYAHCENVARVSFWISRRFSIPVDDYVLITGAFLHDFFLYDWHIPDTHPPLHGFSHAAAACRNAVRYFHVGPKEQAVILCHMWPLNITCVPSSREAVIVCIADKICTLIETLGQRKHSFPIGE